MNEPKMPNLGEKTLESVKAELAKDAFRRDFSQGFDKLMGEWKRRWISAGRGPKSRMGYIEKVFPGLYEREEYKEFEALEKLIEFAVANINKCGEDFDFILNKMSILFKGHFGRECDGDWAEFLESVLKGVHTRTMELSK